MELGIFTRLVKRDTLKETFAQLKAYSLFHQQFNLTCAGLPMLPSDFDEDKANEILSCAKEYGIILDGISGTFNMINPNKEELEEDLRRFPNLCQYAKALGIRFINLCGGSKSPKGKFVWDDLNNTKEAFDDLVACGKRIAKIAEEYGVILCLEVETCIIVDTAIKARNLLDEVGSPNLKIVMDNGNLLFGKNYPDNNAALKEAFLLLGKDIVLANVKDFKKVNGVDTYVAPGKGEMDFKYYISLLREYGYDGPLMLHGLLEEEIETSVSCIREAL